jgi:hypothetical protein
MDMIPPPQPHEEVDEKTRLRRQEELLLPSQPPQEGEASNRAQPQVPTAPVIVDGTVSNEGGIPNDGTTTPSSLHPASVTSARSGDTIRPHSRSPPSPPPPPSSDNDYTDDKQEMERRRLIAQVSAPPGVEDEACSSSTASVPTPSAPTLNEDDYNVRTLHHDHMGADLPQYER